MQAIQLLEEVVVLRGLVDLVQVHAVLVVEVQPAINLVLDGVALLWVGGVLLDDLHRDLLTGRLLHRELDNGERPAVLHTVWLVRRKARGECRRAQSSVVTGVHPAMCHDSGRSVGGTSNGTGGACSAGGACCACCACCACGQCGARQHLPRTSPNV